MANSLILQDWRFTLNSTPDPADSTEIEVVETPYPMPAWLMLTDLIVPCTVSPDALSPGPISGTRYAPVPFPLSVTISLGGELYPNPALSTITSTILPWALTIGVNSASWPERRSIDGDLLKLITSEDPYPTPEFSKWIEVISPSYYWL